MYIFFFIFFSVVVYYRIVNLVPCTIKLDLFIHAKCNSLHLLTPNSQSIPPLSLFSLAIPSLFSMSESVLYVYAQLCPTLCNHRDCSPPGSSVHGNFQARILEWVAISYSIEKAFFPFIKVSLTQLVKEWLEVPQFPSK